MYKKQTIKKGSYWYFSVYSYYFISYDYMVIIIKLIDSSNLQKLNKYQLIYFQRFIDFQERIVGKTNQINFSCSTASNYIF